MYNASMKRIFRLLLAVWFLCFCVFTLKKEAIFSSFFLNVKDIFVRQLLQEEKEVVAYDDLGTEAIRKLQVENFPVIVVIDSEGNNLYESAIKEYCTYKNE